MIVTGGSYFEDIRKGLGENELKGTFDRMAGANAAVAVNYLNEEGLTFPTLFLLSRQIDECEGRDSLNERNAAALKLCSKVRNKEALSCLSRGDMGGIPPRRDTLSWMFKTGASWDAPKEERESYDAAIDMSAALLVRDHGDVSILSDIVNLIFRRNRNGLLIHDLVWSFFGELDLEELKKVASYLLSGRDDDFELCCRLLNIDYEQGMLSPTHRRQLYDSYLKWLSENGPYLYLSNEHFQMTSEPRPIKVDYFAKYLKRPINSKSQAPLDPYSKEELVLMDRFNKISEHGQRLLSSYCAALYDSNREEWRRFLQFDLKGQLDIARARLEAEQ